MCAFSLKFYLYFDGDLWIARSVFFGNEGSQYTYDLYRNCGRVNSFLGYTPDIFMSPSIEYLLDNYSGSLGHRLVFLSLSIFALIGAVATFLFLKLQTMD